ncbi:MAG: hypothetical protein S4CHLAM102_09610 [Chlamydiia bacterium]|nr:hypothetical protein [Chlamydiia bacterium]
MKSKLSRTHVTNEYLTNCGTGFDLARSAINLARYDIRAGKECNLGTVLGQLDRKARSCDEVKVEEVVEIIAEEE